VHKTTIRASQAFWQVDDIERVVAELKSRGVTFEDDELPGMKTHHNIATAGGAKAASFKDPPKATSWRSSRAFDGSSRCRNIGAAESPCPMQPAKSRRRAHDFGVRRTHGGPSIGGINAATVRHDGRE
jgi:hypothetical protein